MNDIKILYFASLREQRGLSSESLKTECRTALELWNSLSLEHKLDMKLEILKVAANDEYVDFNYQLKSGDQIVFIPPVAGG
jgi:molybdopterin synthase sulfur carrier subunit